MASPRDPPSDTPADSPQRPSNRLELPNIADRTVETQAGVVLFCGLEFDSRADKLHPWSTDSPIVAAVPHFLPSERETIVSPDPPPRKRQKKSTACGARVHINARGVGLWCAPIEGVAREVIPLDAMYFSQEAANVLNLHVKECGCQTSGVGCLICGNPLGALSTSCALHTPSEAAADSLPASEFDSIRYRFLPSTISPPLPRLHRQPTPEMDPRQMFAPPTFRAFLPIRAMVTTATSTTNTAVTAPITSTAGTDIAANTTRLPHSARMSTAGRPRRGSRGNPPTVSSTAPPGVASPETPTDAPAADAPRIRRRVRLGAFGFGLGEWDVFNNSDRGSSRVTASPNSGCTDADAGRSLASAMMSLSGGGEGVL